MRKRRDLIAEITQRRARLGRLEHPTSKPRRLADLDRALGALGTEPDSEMLRYFPIGIVACLQGYFREAIARLVDAGSPYRENAASSAIIRESRFDYAVLIGLEGRHISVGDVVAALFPLNSLFDINNALSATLGASFFDELKIVVDEVAVRLESAPATPILRDPAQVFAQIDHVFEYRHVFAHELAPVSFVEASKVRMMLDAADRFLHASSSLVWQRLHPNAPLTQEEFHYEASQRAATAEGDMELHLQALIDSLPADTRDQAKEAQGLWVAYRDKAIRVELGPPEDMGSWGPMQLCLASERYARTRITDLQSAIDSQISC